MNRQDLNIVTRVFNYARSLKNHMNHIEIYSPIYSFGRDNFNLKFRISDKLSRILDEFYHHALTDWDLEKKYRPPAKLEAFISRKLGSKEYIQSEYISCSSYYEYLIKAQCVRTILYQLFNGFTVRVKISGYQGNDFDENEYTEMERARMLEGKNWYKENFKERPETLMYKVRNFIDSCKSAEKKSIVRKLAKGTGLTNKQIEKHKDLIDAYKQAADIKKLISAKYIDPLKPL